MDSIPANDPPRAAATRREPAQTLARGRGAKFGLPLCLAAATSAGVALGHRLAGADAGELSASVLFALALAGGLGVWLERRASRPLSIAATLLDALRHGDYAHRARVDVVQGPSVALLSEVNELADYLGRRCAEAER